MKPLVCGLAVSLLSGCTVLMPTADQVPDESGNGAAIYSDDATISIVYAGQPSGPPVFLVSVTNHTDDTLLLEPQVLRYFASSTPFVPVQSAPDDWFALSAHNSKLPMVMHFAMDPAFVSNGTELSGQAGWRIVPPYGTVEEIVPLAPEDVCKYYRLVMVVSGDFYVFDFVRRLEE